MSMSSGTAPHPDASTPAQRRRRRKGPRKGDLKEGAILDTAWRLLAEKPMTSITVDELAAGAGISRSSFYFYFTSRDAVVRALAERTSKDLREAVLEPMSPGRPARETFRSVIANLLARWRAHGPVLRAMDSLSERDPQLREFWSAISHDVVAVFAEAIGRERSSGRAPDGPPPALDLAWGLTHLYWRSGHQVSLGGDPSEDDGLIDTLTLITLRAIYSDLR
jgi:TetR/AcrR family transcriptional regulator, ethionamide resistance regulator